LAAVRLAAFHGQREFDYPIIAEVYQHFSVPLRASLEREGGWNLKPLAWLDLLPRHSRMSAIARRRDPANHQCVRRAISQ
jgi:hypothetical protein